MSALTFTLKENLALRLNCSVLTPNNLANKSMAEIAKLPIIYGKQKLCVGDVFGITGSDTQQLCFINTSNQLDYLGAYMTSGSIHIEGHVGAYLGLGMKQGEIHSLGNTAAYAACNMAGGLIRIDGNTGDFLGGATAGLRKGMGGGAVIIKGNAGDRVGDQMRRGLILIEGTAGDYCASRMIAGTIGVLGKVGTHAGFNMQRGTLLLAQKPLLHSTMQYCGTHDLPFLSLLLKSFVRLNTQFADIKTQRVQRFVGDVACGGNGEILLMLPARSM